MSLKRIGQLRAFGSTAAVVGLSLMIVPSAVAQRTQFNPVLTVSTYHTDSVDFADERRSSDVYRLALDLPLQRELARGSFLVGLTPFIERFGSADVYDNDGLWARMRLSLQPSVTSQFEFRSAFRRSQDQSDEDRLEDPDLFLARRLQRDVKTTRFAYARHPSSRWSWDLAAGFSEWDFEEIDADRAEPPLLVIEDRTALTFDGGFLRVLSPRASVGLRYGLSRYELELNRDERVQLLSFALVRRLSAHWQLDLLAGANSRSGTASDGTDFSASGPQGSLRFTRELRRMELSALVENTFRVGGALAGTAEYRAVEVSLTDRALRRWHGEIYARVTRRIPGESDLAVVDYGVVSGRLEYDLERTFGLRVDVSYTDYRAEDLGDGAYYRAGASMIWYPMGRTRIAGGPGDA